MNTNFKYELIEKLIHTDDDLILNQIKGLLDGSEIQLWEELNPKLRESLLRGIVQFKNSEGVIHEQLIKEARACFAT